MIDIPNNYGKEITWNKIKNDAHIYIYISVKNGVRQTDYKIRKYHKTISIIEISRNRQKY